MNQKMSPIFAWQISVAFLPKIIFQPPYAISHNSKQHFLCDRSRAAISSEQVKCAHSCHELWLTSTISNIIHELSGDAVSVSELSKSACSLIELFKWQITLYNCGHHVISKKGNQMKCVLSSRYAQQNSREFSRWLLAIKIQTRHER